MRVSAIVVCFRSEALVEPWLAAMRAQTHADLELIVVDNGSGDGTADRVAGQAGVELVRARVNHGFGAGCELGAARATGDALLFMNPDVAVGPELVATLAGHLSDDRSIGIVCPDADGDGPTAHAAPGRLEDVAAMPASAMLVRSALHRELGGFDPTFFLYSEDTDLCFRAWLSGARVVKAWDAAVGHEVGGTGGGSRWAAEQVRGSVRVALRYRSPRDVLRVVALAMVKSTALGIARRDARLAGVWLGLARGLPRTLGERRARRGTATPAAVRRLDALAREHDHWQSVGRRARLRWTARARLRSPRGGRKRD